MLWYCCTEEREYDNVPVCGSTIYWFCSGNDAVGPLGPITFNWYRYGTAAVSRTRYSLLSVRTWYYRYQVQIENAAARTMHI